MHRDVVVSVPLSALALRCGWTLRGVTRSVDALVLDVGLGPLKGGAFGSMHLLLQVEVSLPLDLALLVLLEQLGRLVPHLLDLWTNAQLLILGLPHQGVLHPHLILRRPHALHAEGLLAHEF